MIEWVLIGIAVLFLLFVFIRKPIYKRFGWKICAICTAVSLSWITLIVLKLTGFEVSSILIGILMGESITGAMYLFEKTAKKEGKNNLLWLKVVIILLGTVLVYLFLTQSFSAGLLVVLVISVIFTLVLYGALKSKKSKQVVEKKYGKFRSEIEKLEEQFEHCCD